MKSKNSEKKIFVLLALLIILAGLFISFRESILDLMAQLNLSSLKNNYSTLATYFTEHPIRSGLIYVSVYIAIAALSLPGAALLTVAGGALFGVLWGTILVSFASTIGATAAFLLTRYFFRNYVRTKFGSKLKVINEGIKRDGAFYLLSMRLVPIFPFFAVNVLMALTPIKTKTFFIASQIGMLFGTVIYVNAGTQLASLNSIGDILSAPLLISLFVLGLFPLTAKGILNFITKRRVYRSWHRPKKFDYNLIVIGGGAAGLVSAYIGTAVKAKVALVEKHQMGGDCLNTGCVPSKALIKTAHFIAESRDAAKLGIKDANISFEFAEVMRRVKKVIKQIEPHDSIERYSKLGVDCFLGDAKITTPWTVQIRNSDGDLQELSARSIIVAAGARPIVPPLPGLKDVDYATSDTIWDIEKLPQKLIVIGGGAIGCELSQAFQRLGSEVVLIESLDRILVKEDDVVSDAINNKLSDEGIAILTRHRAKGFITENNKQYLVCDSPNGELRLAFDKVLFAIGRQANTMGYGLEDIDAITSDDKIVPTNEYLQTKYPNVYACGDVTGKMQFTHAAAHQAWYASVNALFGTFKKFSVDFSSVPWATFTHPQVARVGLNELDAKDQGIEYELTSYGLDDLDRAIADSDDHGYVRVLTKPGSDQILGVTIVGEHAAETIAEFVLAMKNKLGLNKILGTTHIYPTFSEANKYVSGEWKKKHTPEKLLKLVELLHRIARG